MSSVLYELSLLQGEEVEVEQDRLEVVGFTSAEQRELRGDKMLRQ